MRQHATAKEIREALRAEALRFREAHKISVGERLIAADLNAIRRTTSARFGIALPDVERKVSDSHAGGHERDPLWAVLLDQKWLEAWVEHDGRPPCCSIERFAAHGVRGVELLEIAERKAVAEIRKVVRKIRTVPM